ncbi:MAG: hypothetical protein A2293_10535 [Elusimicrobia bacterium RIFOXYB2_FULL_49_7]|nr:MAG: hypothetical protein A2293_10535 [Elusimicrobia bacterium RIFOXYB2_FULL_49_7]
MKNIIVVLLISLMSLAGCSKTAQGKRAYAKGDYKKAISLFEAALIKNGSNVTAGKYMALAHSGLRTDEAAALLQQGNQEEALALLDEAMGLDSANQDAQTLMKQTLQTVLNQISKEYLPSRAWDKAIAACNLISKYRPDDAQALLLKARAVYESEKGVANYKVILALQQAEKKAPKDPFVRMELDRVKGQTGKFAAIFAKYQDALIKKDFKTWKSIITPKFSADVDKIVQDFIKEDDPRLKNANDYFLELSGDPVKYNSPEGATVICIEPLSANRAFIHFIYKDYPKVLRMEAETIGNVLKLHKEEDSPIKKTDLY